MAHAFLKASDVKSSWELVTFACSRTCVEGNERKVFTAASVTSNYGVRVGTRDLSTIPLAQHPAEPQIDLYIPPLPAGGVVMPLEDALQFRMTVRTDALNLAFALGGADRGRRNIGRVFDSYRRHFHRLVDSGRCPVVRQFKVCCTSHTLHAVQHASL